MMVLQVAAVFSTTDSDKRHQGDNLERPIIQLGKIHPRGDEFPTYSAPLTDLFSPQGLGHPDRILSPSHLIEIKAGRCWWQWAQAVSMCYRNCVGLMCDSYQQAGLPGRSPSHTLRVWECKGPRCTALPFARRELSRVLDSPPALAHRAALTPTQLCCPSCPDIGPLECLGKPTYS